MAIKRYTSATPARAGEKSRKVARGRSARPASRDSGGSLPDPGLNVAQNGEKLQKVLARGRSRHPASRAVQGSTNVAGSRMLRATDTGTSLYGAGSKVGPSGEKVQKVLARAGVGSRREMERWIEQARITIDGQPAKIGDRVRPGQRLRIDGRELPHASLAPKPRVLIYHKPEGEITTRNDPEGRATVFDNLPQIRQGRWIAIGRLDLNSSGLLMFTTDGELANRLMHPSAEIEREYAVRILGAVAADAIGRLTTGVTLEDGPARLESVVDAGGTGANHWYHVVIREGRNREVRRLWEAVGATVSRLIRVRYGPITLPRLLRPGRSAYLEREELEGLYAAAGLPSPTPERHKSATGRRGRPPRAAVRRRAGKR